MFTNESTENRKFYRGTNLYLLQVAWIKKLIYNSIVCLLSQNVQSTVKLPVDGRGNYHIIWPFSCVKTLNKTRSPLSRTREKYFWHQNLFFRRWKEQFSKVHMCLATVEQTWSDVKEPYKGKQGRLTYVITSCHMILLITKDPRVICAWVLIKCRES